MYRVFQVVESFGGGVFQSVRQICNNLPRDLFEVYLIYSLRKETPSNWESLIREDVKKIYLPMTREISPIADLKALFGLIKLIKRYDPHIIHLHSSKAGFLGRLAAFLLRRKRVFYSPRGFSFLMKDVSVWKRALFFYLEKIAASFGGVILACSLSELAEAKKLSLKAKLLNNAIDLEEIDEIPPHIFNEDKIRVAIVGRVTYARAPWLFKNIACKLSSPLVEFLWIGGGELEDEIKSSPVKVLGWLSRKEAISYLKGIDIYLQTSLWEGMPIAVLEAMACSKPVVATDVVGNRDVVIHGETGFVGKDENELVLYLRRLIENRDLRLKMGIQGRRRVEREFSLEVLIEKLSSLYLEVVKS
ncbi:MAG: glycosyltransferase family 4 protein [Synergistetes bacterium]|nr:glycosyltransferase family 4 protein [Synergistota bacterium]MCX8128385.1 glycosyltransferase family 4 protein [Synergistota bacterium]MDW8192421.1 glycosyltransferase family 4 protein [Synergistota bacterium]